MYVEDFALGVIAELGSKFLYAQKMGVESAAPDLVASGLAYHGVTEACYEWPDEHHAAAQTRTAFKKLVALYESGVDFVCLKGVVAFGVLVYLDSDVLQQAYLVVDVVDIGDIADVYGLVGKQSGAEDL